MRAVSVSSDINPYEPTADLAEAPDHKNRTILFLLASVVILAGMVYWQRSEIKELRDRGAFRGEVIRELKFRLSLDQGESDH